MKIKIVQAGRNHMEAIRRMRNGANAYLINKVAITPEAQWKFYDRKVATGKYMLWLVQDGSLPVGYLQARNIKKGRDCEVGIYLDPAVRGKGVGKRVMEMLLTTLKSRGFKECWLEVLKSNIHAQNLFMRAGFQAEYVDDGRDIYGLRKVL